MMKVAHPKRDLLRDYYNLKFKNGFDKFWIFKSSIFRMYLVHEKFILSEVKMCVQCVSLQIYSWSNTEVGTIKLLIP